MLTFFVVWYALGLLGLYIMITDIAQNMGVTLNEIWESDRRKVLIRSFLWSSLGFVLLVVAITAHFTDPPKSPNTKP